MPPVRTRRQPRQPDLQRGAQRDPGIRAIAFNGKGAEKLFRRYFGTYVDTYETLVLPSTSPAYTLTFERKLEGWRRLLPYLSGLSAGMPADTR